MGAFLAKALTIVFIAAIVFGGAAYYAYELFLRPAEDLKKEKLAPTTPLPPDPALPDFKAAKQKLTDGDLLGAREALTRFVEQNPYSTLIDDARDLLGGINTDLFLSTKPAPEKQVYIVRPGDVLNKVARVTKTNPDLLLRANGLTTNLLRIDQRLFYTPADFSIAVSKKRKKVTLLNFGKFFKQYAIRTMPAAGAKKGAVVPGKQHGKIVEKIAWGPSGGRVISTDPGYAQATFWISTTIPGHTFYSDPDPSTKQEPNKPPTGGIGIAPEAAAELAALLSKGNALTIEN